MKFATDGGEQIPPSHQWATPMLTKSAAVGSFLFVKTT